MKNIKGISLFVLIITVITMVILAGAIMIALATPVEAGWFDMPTPKAQQVTIDEQTKQQQAQDKLVKAQPAMTIDWSLERDNLNKRIDRWNDPNKVSYIYLIGDNGIIMGFFSKSTFSCL